MWPHCRVENAYCYGPPTWILGQTPWTDADQIFTICTPLLTTQRIVVLAWPRSPPLPAVVVVVGGGEGEGVGRVHIKQGGVYCSIATFVTRN